MLVMEWEGVRALDLGKAASLIGEPTLLVNWRNALEQGFCEGRGDALRGLQAWLAPALAPGSRGPS